MFSVTRPHFFLLFVCLGLTACGKYERATVRNSFLALQYEWLSRKGPTITVINGYDVKLSEFENYINALDDFKKDQINSDQKIEDTLMEFLYGKYIQCVALDSDIANNSAYAQRVRDYQWTLNRDAVIEAASTTQSVSEQDVAQLHTTYEKDHTLETEPALWQFESREQAQTAQSHYHKTPGVNPVSIPTHMSIRLYSLALLKNISRTDPLKDTGMLDLKPFYGFGGKLKKHSESSGLSMMELGRFKEKIVRAKAHQSLLNRFRALGLKTDVAHLRKESKLIASLLTKG